MGVVDDLGDDLARRTIEAMDETGNDRFYMEVARVIAASSPTLQEAFMTSIRVRLAAQRAARFIDGTLRARREGGAAPEAPKDLAPPGASGH
ncbi:MAG: hypothetical protein N2Z62_12080 [Rhodobacteraceae bacterium]|nr:hypothetical protein [Paracoccaceae bacterium]